MSDPNRESAGSDYRLVGPIASRTPPLHSVALRVTITWLKKSYSNNSLPIDNPHRSSGDLGRVVMLVTIIQSNVHKWQTQKVQSHRKTK